MRKNSNHIILQSVVFAISAATGFFAFAEDGVQTQAAKVSELENKIVEIQPARESEESGNYTEADFRTTINTDQNKNVYVNHGLHKFTYTAGILNVDEFRSIYTQIETRKFLPKKQFFKNIKIKESTCVDSATFQKIKKNLVCSLEIDFVRYDTRLKYTNFPLEKLNSDNQFAMVRPEEFFNANFDLRNHKPIFYSTKFLSILDKDNYPTITSAIKTRPKFNCTTLDFLPQADEKQKIYALTWSLQGFNFNETLSSVENGIAFTSTDLEFSKINNTTIELTNIVRSKFDALGLVPLKIFDLEFDVLATFLNGKDKSCIIHVTGAEDVRVIEERFKSSYESGEGESVKFKPYKLGQDEILNDLNMDEWSAIPHYFLIKANEAN